jgi:AcrR family transcriptional regulator
VPETSRRDSPPDAPKRRRPQARGVVTRQRILDAAEELFAQKGYEGTTLRDIARNVGLSNPSLYNHFEDKEALYGAVLQRGIGPVLTRLVEAVEHERDSSDAAPEIIRMAMQALGERPGLARLVQHEVLRGGQRLSPMLLDYMAPVFAAGGRMAASRIEEAGWEEADVPHLVLTMIQAVLGFFSMASLVQELSGQDLLTESSLARQTRFLIELSQRLFSPTTQPH